MVQENSMKKLVIITGLTCSGKSSLAIDIAKKNNGEIISADSVQIYKGLDIGSAKESYKIMAKIKHHLINIKEFNETYSVGEFLHDCEIAITNIISKGKLPIIVGGTGLYIKALLDGYTFGNAEKDNDLRDKYQNLAKIHGNEYVWAVLNEINPDKAKTVHFNNLKRVIRYLEIEENSKEQKENKLSILDNYNICCVGIIDEREQIYARINGRVDEMLSNGLETEVRHLIKCGASRENQSMNSIGYKEWFDYLDGKATREETVALIKQHTRNYCKRQLTFLKTINNINLCTLNSAKKYIESFLNNDGE